MLAVRNGTRLKWAPVVALTAVEVESSRCSTRRSIMNDFVTVYIDARALEVQQPLDSEMPKCTFFILFQWFLLDEVG